MRYGYTAFGESTMMRSKLGKFLTGSPVMRTGYAVLKAMTFSWLLLISAMDRLWNEIPFLTEKFLSAAYLAGYIAAMVTAVVSLARGIPAIIEGTQMIVSLDAKQTQANTR
jgi:hypothetical protein